MHRTTMHAVIVIAIKAVAMAALFILASAAQAVECVGQVYAGRIVASETAPLGAAVELVSQSAEFPPSGHSYPEYWESFVFDAPETSGFDRNLVVGTPCAEFTSFALMTRGEYELLISGMEVNETLHYGFMVLSLLAGLGFGWYMFGPKRRSVIDIES